MRCLKFRSWHGLKFHKRGTRPFKRGRGRSAHTSPGPQSNSTHIFMGHGPDIWRGNKNGRSLTLPMPLLTPVRSANGDHGMYWTPVLPPPQHNRRTALNPPSQPDNVQQPADNVQQPATCRQRPATSGQRPATSRQRPAASRQPPPPATSRQPAATSRQPPSTSSQPTGAPTPHSAGRPRAEVTCQPASIYHVSCFLIAAQGTIPCCCPPPQSHLKHCHLT